MTVKVERRPEVEAFASAMDDELDRNEYKGGWERDTDCRRAWQVFYHSLKLCDEFLREGGPRPERVREFAADVGNEAMFVADRVGGLESPQAPQPCLTGKIGLDSLREWFRDRYPQATDADLLPSSPPDPRP